MAANNKPSLAVLRSNFAEFHPPMRGGEAATESSRCLYCFDAPCVRACPTRINIPRFIGQILHQDTLGAAETILDANIFGGSCARVCPTEVLCEGACVDNTLLSKPVLIGRLQRHACDTAQDASIDFHRPGPDTGKKVAIVGAGPAGLTCAHELRKRGHAVTVFEAANVPGGLNTVGIAAYKLSTKFALSEVNRILRMGIDLRLKSPVDGKMLSGLLDSHDAVFLAIGLGRTAPLQIPGEDLKGVWESLEFIAQTRTKALNRCQVGERVVVIGGGNTAIDAACAAARLGADSVTLVYRRDKNAMPAFEHEYELAVAGGVQIMWLTRPLNILGRGGKVSGLRAQRVRLDGKGRKAALKVVRNSEFTIPCDMVIKALGQETLTVPFDGLPKLKLTRAGRIVANAATGATSVPKLFAGGDCQDGAGEEVVNAVRDGKIAADGIHRLLSS